MRSDPYMAFFYIFFFAQQLGTQHIFIIRILSFVWQIEYLMHLRDSFEVSNQSIPFKSTGSIIINYNYYYKCDLNVYLELRMVGGCNMRKPKPLINCKTHLKRHQFMCVSCEL